MFLYTRWFTGGKTCIEMHVLQYMYLCMKQLLYFPLPKMQINKDFYLMFQSTRKFKEIKANKKLIKQTLMIKFCTFTGTC